MFKFSTSQAAWNLFHFLDYFSSRGSPVINSPCFQYIMHSPGPGHGVGRPIDASLDVRCLELCRQSDGVHQGWVAELSHLQRVDDETTTTPHVSQIWRHAHTAHSSNQQYQSGCRDVSREDEKVIRSKHQQKQTITTQFTDQGSASECPDVKNYKSGTGCFIAVWQQWAWKG